MFDKSPIKGFVTVYQTSSWYLSVIVEEGVLSCVDTEQMKFKSGSAKYYQLKS